MNIRRVKVSVGGREITLETGRLAKQASGSVLVSAGESAVLVTAVASKAPREGIDFFPLTVDYIEKTFSGGKIPGGFFKREGRLTEREVLTSRCIDRPCRPLFPKGFKNDVQIMATVLSMGTDDNLTDVLAMTGASTALMLSDIPWGGPLAGVRVGRIDGKLVANPTREAMEHSDMEIVVAASRDTVNMVEGEGKFVSEDDMADAILFGQEAILGLLDAQLQLQKELGKPKRPFVGPVIDEGLKNIVNEFCVPKLKEAFAIKDKLQRRDALEQVHAALKTKLVSEIASGKEAEVKKAFESIEKKVMRDMVASDRKRIDGRALDEIRPIYTEVGVFPRTHGSGLFQRGETQVLGVATLGTKDDEQKIDAITGEYYKTFMLHYNFPPFSVGETKPLRSPGRREVGHGNLAERSLRQVMPPPEKFPYTVRLVCEVLESNGSSSMGSVCSGSMALMDAGVPISEPVAGIAMGLIKEGEKIAVLSDILGDEDHLGDMDFKVTGTKQGICGFQMDLKISGITKEILKQALYQARAGRLWILDKMAESIKAPRPEISPYAPRIVTIKISPNKIRDVIGPGGKTIRSIVDQCGVKIDVQDDGTVNVASANREGLAKAQKMIKDLTQEPEKGKLYLGLVKRIMEFGAFVEILPGTDGLLHISEIAKERVKSVTDVLREGDEVLVKCIDVDRDGKIRLSRKEALGKTLADLEAQG
jgi:polyribonucleotide nucleotidyltransferase